MSFSSELNTANSFVYQFVQQAFPGLSHAENPALAYYAQHAPVDGPAAPSHLQQGETLLVDRALTHRLSWALGAEEIDTESFSAPWRRGTESIAIHQQRLQYAAADDERREIFRNDPARADRISGHMRRIGQTIVGLGVRQAHELELIDSRRNLLRGPQVEQQLVRTAMGKNLLEKAYFATSHSLSSRYPFGKTINEEVFKNDPSVYARILLQGFSDHLVEDVRHQVALIDEMQPGKEKFSFAHLVERGRSGKALYAPHFPLGWLLGGVYGDLLADGCLVAVNNDDTSALLGNCQLRELIACTLLDTDNQLDITSVGVYKSRRGYFCEFGLDDLSNQLSAVASWPVLRREFRAMLLEDRPPRRANGSTMAIESNQEAQKIRQLST